jgi:putative membrane protein insertion efficiency factor
MKWLMIGAIDVYRRWVSPMLPPSCRYYPTCSEYAKISLEKHGVFKGSALAAWRILRCNPFSTSGYDPVP